MNESVIIIYEKLSDMIKALFVIHRAYKQFFLFVVIQPRNISNGRQNNIFTVVYVKY